MCKEVKYYASSIDTAARMKGAINVDLKDVSDVISEEKTFYKDFRSQSNGRQISRINTHRLSNPLRCRILKELQL